MQLCRGRYYIDQTEVSHGTAFVAMDMGSTLAEVFTAHLNGDGVHPPWQLVICRNSIFALVQILTFTEQLTGRSPTSTNHTQYLFALLRHLGLVSICTLYHWLRNRCQPSAGPRAPSRQYCRSEPPQVSRHMPTVKVTVLKLTVAACFACTGRGHHCTASPPT